MAAARVDDASMQKLGKDKVFILKAISAQVRTPGEEIVLEEFLEVFSDCVIRNTSGNISGQSLDSGSMRLGDDRLVLSNGFP